MISGHRAFGQIELAKKYRTRRLQLRNDLRIVIGYEIPFYSEATHGGDVRRIAKILYGDRHAMQRTTVVAGRNSRFRITR